MDGAVATYPLCGGCVFKYSRIPKSREVNIPGTYGRYLITTEGAVFDKFLDKIIDPSGREYLLVLPWHEGPIDIAKLIAVCFKGWRASLDLVKQCDILYSDNNVNNLRPKNLIWKFPNAGIEVPTLPGYYFIPSFTSYAINREGMILSLIDGDLKVTNLATTGYRDLGLRRDDGIYVGTNLHRVYALTFIPYGFDINTLVVNHKNGDRDDITLSNLEWVTQSENVQHGYAMKQGYVGTAKNIGIIRMLQSRGVNTDGIELIHDGVEVKNILTGEVTFYDSQQKASEAINVSTGTISLKISGTAIYPVIHDKYIVRRVGTSWPTWDASKEYIQAKNKATVVKNVHTGEILRFESAKATYLGLNLSKKTVTTKLKRADLRPTNGYIIKYDDGLNEF